MALVAESRNLQGFRWLQDYIGSLLDVVQGGVDDADSINAQLDRVAGILDTDVNNTDINAQIQVGAAQDPA